MMESFQMPNKWMGLVELLENKKCKDIGQIKFEIELSILYDSYVGCQRKDYLEQEVGEKIIWNRREEKVL